MYRLESSQRGSHVVVLERLHARVAKRTRRLPSFIVPLSFVPFPSSSHRASRDATREEQGAVAAANRRVDPGPQPVAAVAGSSFIVPLPSKRGRRGRRRRARPRRAAARVIRAAVTEPFALVVAAAEQHVSRDLEHAEPAGGTADGGSARGTGEELAARGRRRGRRGRGRGRWRRRRRRGRRPRIHSQDA